MNLSTSISDQPGNGRPLSPGEFLDPLGVILHEHRRQRKICDELDSLANSLGDRPVIERAKALLVYLTEDLPLHTEDEEMDLFPLLARRCVPEDGVDAILEQLSSEHTLDKDVVEFIVSDLKLVAGGMSLANPVRFYMNVHGFAVTHRRHLAWENQVVVPLARKRLTDTDIEELGRAMATRRGIEHPN